MGNNRDGASPCAREPVSARFARRVLNKSFEPQVPHFISCKMGSALIIFSVYRIQIH